MDAADKPIEGYYARAVAAQLTRAKAELDDAEGKLESLRTEFAEIEKKGKKHEEVDPEFRPKFVIFHLLLLNSLS